MQNWKQETKSHNRVDKKNSNENTNMQKLSDKQIDEKLKTVIKECTNRQINCMLEILDRHR